MCLQHAGVGTDPVKWKWNCSRCWVESPNQLEESCRSCVHHGLGYVHYSNWGGCASNWCGCASSRMACGPMAHLYIKGMHVQSWMITQWTPPAVLDTPHYACYSEFLHCTMHLQALHSSLCTHRQQGNKMVFVSCYIASHGNAWRGMDQHGRASRARDNSPASYVPIPFQSPQETIIHIKYPKMSIRGFVLAQVSMLCTPYLQLASIDRSLLPTTSSTGTHAMSRKLADIAQRCCWEKYGRRAVCVCVCVRAAWSSASMRAQYPPAVSRCCKETQCCRSSWCRLMGVASDFINSCRVIYFPIRTQLLPKNQANPSIVLIPTLSLLVALFSLPSLCL